MTPKISIVIPFHWMKNWQFFLMRCLESIEKQSFKDYEVILMKVGSMPITSNRVIEGAKGEIIKVLYMDDWLESEDYLEKLWKAFEDRIEWVVTSASTNKNPEWTDDIETGNNRLGSPSALAFRNNFEGNELFAEKLSWVLDCDLYKRLEWRFGRPKILTDISVGIGVHEGQATNLLTNEEKLEEIEYLKNKYI